MLIRLTPEQLSQGWAVVRPLIVKTLPPTLRVNAVSMGNIFASLMKEDAQFWAYYRKEGDGRPLSIVMTSVVLDRVSGSKYLLVYSMYALVPMTAADYRDGIETLKTFAQEVGCAEVLAYVEDDRFVRILHGVGAVKLSNLMRL